MTLTHNDVPQAIGRLIEEFGILKRMLSEQQSTSIPQEEKPINADAAADFLDLAKPTLYSKVSRREIPFHKRNGRLYFFKSELLEYLKEGQVKTLQQLENDATILTKKGGSK